MSEVTKPILLDETFKAKMDLQTAELHKIALAITGRGGISSWENLQVLAKSGVARDYLELGQVFAFKRDSVDIPCFVVDFIDNNKKGSIKIKSDNLQHGIIFQTIDNIYSLQFDEREAFYYTADGLSAGNYRFKLGEHSWVSADVGKTFYFHLDNAVPAGGQLVWKQSYDATLEGASIDVFDSGNDFTANETVTMSSAEIAGATDLGTINNAFNGNFNSCQRALLGNNRWKESAIRQHLNSYAAVGSVWTPQNHWDRPPSWKDSTKGFMNGLETSFTNYVADVEIDTYRNTVCDGGGLDTTEDKFFLAGRNELFFPQEGADNGIPFELYKQESISSIAHAAADLIRVKKTSGSAAYWWMRAPYVGNAPSVRNVIPTGEFSTSTATTSLGVAPAFVIA